MSNAFLDDTTRALRELRRRQDRRVQLDDRARRAFEKARDTYYEQRADAASFEGRAWRALLDVSGMTVSTAAALCGVSVATVNRRTREARDV
jgi:predicted DNA-binding protein (UPF0251 family)